MIRIGEKLNSSIPATRELLANHNGEGLAALARKQLDAGADLLDLNASVFLSDEPELLAWAVRTVQQATGARLMIDSPNPAAVAAALAADTVGRAVVNSVTADPARIAAVAPLLVQHKASVVALCMGPSGIPSTAEGRLEAAERALEGLAAHGIPQSKVWLDPLAEALAANHESAAVTLKAIGLIRARFPEITIVCGLSNVSFGLPQRKAINSAFLIAAVATGLNAAILDPSDQALAQAIAAAEAVAGLDEYCLEYIRYCRAKG